MLALAHAPVQPQERNHNHNQLVQRQTSSSSNHLKRPKSSVRQSSPQPSRSHSHTRSPALHPRDQPEKIRINPNLNISSSSISISSLPSDPFHPFDINALPPSEFLPLLASLLQEIAHANDHLHSSDSRSFTNQDSFSQSTEKKVFSTAAQEALSTPSSTLSFHAQRAPAISLEAYLLRILKYCPTPNEVFLSLLIYFDRMSALSTLVTGKEFVIDSYNIHRLVIAGVTVASKFFSDVFYTNSRYAKVGGLPQVAELNHLELQFLLLNDFNLVIPPEEIQRYASQLIVYSRESKSIPSSPLFERPPMSPVSPAPASKTPNASSVTSVLSRAVQQQQIAADMDGSYDTEDETVCPSISSGASETCSIYTVRNEDDNEHD